MLLSPRTHRRHDEDGASAVEYGLLVALIAAVIVIAVFAFGGMVKATFHSTCTAFTSPGPIQGTCSQ
jgi:pilus assembly protein Flp/PilA